MSREKDFTTEIAAETDGRQMWLFATITDRKSMERREMKSPPFPPAHRRRNERALKRVIATLIERRIRDEVAAEAVG